MSGWAYSAAMLDAQSALIEILYARYGLTIKLTCGACPEQYEVFKDGVQVAYYRLRHGEFTVNFPDVMGEEIFSAEPNGDGTFDENERLKYLTKALRAVVLNLEKNPPFSAAQHG
jgi:hypothetical protein